MRSGLLLSEYINLNKNICFVNSNNNVSSLINSNTADIIQKVASNKNYFFEYFMTRSLDESCVTFLIDNNAKIIITPTFINFVYEKKSNSFNNTDLEIINNTFFSVYLQFFLRLNINVDFTIFSKNDISFLTFKFNRPFVVLVACNIFANMQDALNVTNAQNIL
jgi:hypothetical protein